MNKEEEEEGERIAVMDCDNVNTIVGLYLRQILIQLIEINERLK